MNNLFNKDIANSFDSVIQIIDSLKYSANQHKIVSDLSSRKEGFYFYGIYLYDSADQCTISVGMWSEYYILTGIPVCFGFDYGSDEFNKFIFDKINLLSKTENTITKPMKLDDTIVFGFTENFINEVNKNEDSFFEYILEYTEKIGLKLAKK